MEADPQIPQARYRHLVENVHDAVVEFKFVDGEPIVRGVNEAFVETFGYDPETVRGESLNEWIVPDQLQEEAEALDARTASGNVTTQQITRTTADGPREFLHRSVPYDDDHDIDGIAIYTDITEREAYERQLETQRDNFEVLTHVVCHDVRNDLQTVLTYAELLKSELDGTHERYVDSILTSVRSSVDRTKSAQTVADVTLRQDDDLHPVDFRSTLEAEIADVDALYDGALVRLEGTLPAVEVLADGMLGSVFRNLLTNAIEHNDRPVPEVTVTVDDVLGDVVVRIADDGGGIPDRRKTELFERGKKGFDSNGAGLGLYLVNTLVDRYGGDVRVLNNDAGGATFAVELPIASRLA